MSMGIVEFVQQQEPLFTGALTGDVVTWQKESQFAIQYFQKNDFLAKTALSNPTSAQNAIINVAAIGISLNPASKLAYLVPRDGMVCLDISYMGLLHIAQETGAIKWGQAKIVYANDSYESNGIDSAPTHKYNAFGERGEMVGVYCVVKTSENDYLTQEMSLAEIKQVQETSKAKNGPWVKFFEEMAKKAVIKRAAKTWPRVPRLDVAIDAVNEHEGTWIEPVLAHKPQEEIIAEDNAKQQAVIDKLNALCDAMGEAKDELSLKAIFKEAFLASAGLKIQKDIQAVYNESKIRLGIQ